MKRTIIKIDEDLCNGCGLCVPNCHEGALQVIDGKVRLISDLFCDGLGACIGHCPEGAITLEEREAEPYDEIRVMELMVPKGRNTILAHLEHLKDHNETELLKQAIDYIRSNNIDMSPKEEPALEGTATIAAFSSINQARMASKPVSDGCGGGCPGSKAMSFDIDMDKVNQNTMPSGADAPSELRQWPVQLHLLNPMAGYFKGADVVLAADCVAFAMGNFHNKFLKGKTLAIACPKLDSNKESYVEKLTAMIDQSNINTLHVVTMEVPCCSGLVQLAMIARQQASRNIPIKKTIIGIQGDVQSEVWV
ncbi:MAG TPA: 4Fe-4S binding protein [Lentimicrobium sp.]|nr:4Fe-4S binding protein [Lentimicrobium sp.]